MAKLTTLEYIQRILSAIDAENVTDIDESVESEQAKLILDAEYERLVNRFDWTHKKETGKLLLTSVLNKMLLPENVSQFLWIKYDGNYVKYLKPEDFYDLLDSRDPASEYVDSEGCINDEDPSYYTLLGEREIYFDSYDGNLVSSKTRCMYFVNPAQLLNDLDVPDLPDILHQVLLDACLERAFRELKGDEQSAQVYYSKYMRGIMQAQRWADTRYNETSTFGDFSYARKR